MAFPSAIHDPLAINLRGQTAVLISRLPSDSPHGTTLESALAQPLAQFLNALSTLLSLPELTTLVATIFRPILLDLSARWLDGPQNTEEQLVALCYLLEVHEELFPVLHGLLQRPMFVNGPLAFVLEADSPLSIDVPRLHRLLLAYYRILQANRELPLYLSWSLAPLSCLIWTPELDNAVRLLAIRCYSLQSGMGEGEREKMESEILGQSGGVDCPLEYGRNADGTPIEMDGWVMPVFEVQRIREMRRQIVTEPHNYYEGGQNESWPLSPRLVDVHGVLLFRENGFPSVTSPLISTPTTVEALRTLATHISLRLPTLISSPPSSGKTLLLSHMAELLHPGIKNQIIHIHLADTSLDPRSLLGSYVSSPTRPGTFEWQEGVLVRSMRQGRWVVFEDIDRGSNEVLGVLKPLVESLGPGKWIGQRASLDVPSRGKIIAADGFAIFATRSAVPSRTGTLPPPLFYGSHKFHEILLPSPTSEDLQTIIDSRFPRLAGRAARAFIRLWEAVRALGSAASTRDVGLRDLETFCTRIQRLLPSNAMDVDSDATDAHTTLSSIFPNTTLREDLYLESRDVFFGAGTTTASARVHLENIARVIGEHLGLDPERGAWVLNGRVPDLTVEKDVNGRTVALSVGRTRLLAHEGKVEMAAPPARPFAMHRPAVMLLSRIATAVSIGEPVLLTGETGTGKTSVITHLASVLRRPLISLNLSHQTESADLVGGFKPIDARVPGSALHERFLELFGGTFSRRKNEKFEAEVRKAVGEGRWKRAVGLWKESIRLAKERIQAKATVDPMEDPNANGDTPRKRRKVDHALNVSEADWAAFEKDVGEFEVQHVHAKGKFAFGFVEGPLVKALRSGEWVLLDEVNLASPETLECISSLLHSPTASITLTEQGSLEPVPRHPDFRLFACMNPATDVGKKDLPPNIRSRFIEIDVPPPDADRETLLSIVNQYIGDKAVGDKAAIMNVAEFYAAVKQLADTRQIADGSNHKPHYSMRTLARALTFAADIASTYSLRRAIWEGCLMAFTMVLDAPSAEIVTALAQKHLLMGVRNPRSMLTKEPSVPQGRSADEFVKFGPFYLEKGPSPSSLAEDYILTPSVETKLIDLARIILTRRFPVLIEGPTSSGKTSSVEYLAKRTGHRFIRINNHEHTDIQEYLGSYVSDPVTGKLVFKDGLLVTALRNGDWIVLDELNLAPTDVLEALNRLLDDNRELVIPETQEVVRPHPHFMLFATQNPPGLYAGRKVLSRAFRNRFLEVHFEDVPQAELETILCQRCRIAPSYGKKIVNVFRDLQKRRQFGRVFETKQSFATLRDLFRWAGRDAIGYQELAENGYMLLAERARREDDKVAVKEVIESVMGVKIDEKAIYNLHSADVDFHTYLGCPIPSSSPNLVWTSAMQRLFILVSRALRFNEPVLLVGETGSGKTSVCQIFADASSQVLHGLNCHQNTETADLIGGLRPVRNKSAREAEVYTEGMDILQHLGLTPTAPTLESVMHAVKAALESPTVEDLESRSRLEDVRRKCLRLASIFEWHDGPLVDAMRNGDVFLLDEISLADDSVLERLNSVLEPGRTLVLAERGGNDLEYPAIRAADSFKLVATMNPGGDYGKKELSPALRNRFTEIWVPPVNEHQDLELIIDHTWKVEPLRAYTSKVLGFTEWLSAKIGDTSMSSLRDIMAWVAFSNSVYPVGADEGIAANEIFHHAAHMTFLDGLGSLPQLSGYSREAIVKLKDEALAMLHVLAPLPTSEGHVPIYDSSNWIQLGTFAIPRGPLEPSLSTFNLRAPTTQDNAMRVVRACQVPKPILLEGSPGVGKTSLVNALAHLAGHRLCRINLSDQTDLIDLFGSDLPVESGAPGEFAWKDAEFLTALQQGHWVLLDEMNLAPQAVLEGLNAVLDHRGTVYIPELGRSFSRHPAFRIFAAQNPLNQGGGRKGLPKSFVNRFTKVYVEELTPNDLLLVCQHLFPAIAPETLQGMISFNTTLNDEISVRRSFAREGSPWEFNLRDVLRWAALLSALPALTQPSELLRSVYLERFRDPDDRSRAQRIFDQKAPNAIQEFDKRPRWAISAQHLQFGGFCFPRQNYASPRRPGRLLKTQLTGLEAVGHCVSQSWLSIITGARNSGKTELVRALANFSGRPLHEIALNTATDTMDIIGSFEQVDDRGHVLGVVDSLLSVLKSRVRSVNGSRPSHLLLYDQLSKARKDASTGGDPTAVLLLTTKLINELRLVAVDADENAHLRKLQDQVEQLVSRRDGPGRFEWVDGPLIRAMREGEWLLLDGANLCNPSVLDRLNSLCEVNGFLTLSERGYVDGSVQILRPHPGFRIFMCVDPQHGELSRAMRNRGIEINLPSQPIADDSVVLQDHLRLPLSLKWPDVKTFDTRRRGLVHDIHSTETLATISGRVLDQDSQSSSLLDRVSLLSGASSAVYQFAARTIPAAYTLHFQRFAVQAGGLEVFRNLLRAVPTPGLLPATSSVAEAYARSWGLPLDFVCAQPILFSLDSSATAQRSDTDGHSMLKALDLNVSLYLNSEAAESIEARINPEHAYSNARALKEIDTVIETVRNLAVAALSGMTRDLPANMASIHLASRSLQYANHLQRARGTTHFDYSAVQAISSWLSDALEGCPSNYLPLAQRVRVLRETVALSTGLGMNEMWSKFSADGDFHPSAAMMALDESARRLSSRESAETQALRSQCFELICLSPLQESASVEEKKAFDLLHGDLLKRLQAASSSPVESGAQCEFDSLIPQLGILASCTATQNLVNKIERFLQIERLQPSSSLNRLVVYQHLSWTLKAQKDVSSLTLRLQLQWLSNLWSTVADDGPAMFLRPLEIRSTIASCNMKSGSLTTLAAFERNMQRRLALVLFHCEDNTPRVEQLARVLRQGVQLVAACFAPEADEIRPTLGSIELDLKQALTALDRLKSMPFQAAFKLHLRPHLQRLVSPSHSRQQRVVDLGSCWMGLARTIFELFVPDAPVDPAAIQNCAVEFWKHLRQSLSEQLHLHTQLELSTTGNSENIAVRYLRAQLAEADDHLQHISSHPLRVNISRLHLFWSEVAQFLNHIISRSKTDILVASLRDGEESAILRENVVQQSMAGFSQRLDSVYPEFADINTPLKLAVFYFRIGLRLVASTFILSDPACDYAVDLSQSLVAFPSARASAAILTDPESRPLVVTPFRHLLLNLAAVVVDARAGIDSATYADLIQTTYEQAQRLWRIDRAREGEAAAASVSLYRHKVDYNDVGEAEMEEREFLLLFPQFENVLDADMQIEALAVDGTLASRLESIEVSQLAELHHTLFGDSDDRAVKGLEIFSQLRKNTLETLLHTRFPSLSERLDAESLHFQLALIRDRLSSMQTASSTDSQPYNFYVDANIPEAKKAVAVIHALKARLQNLIQEWPDQMVLQHLVGRCDTVLALDLSSPVAKVLSALEQLLIQTADWEIYANRHNTLKDHQSALTNLIVEWRRLELACWKVLLESQAKSFADGTADWWFHIYDATICGSLDAAERERNDQATTLTDYLSKLIPLLDDFIRSSPLGQFQARMELLRSFEIFCVRLASTKTGIFQQTLHRVRRILHATQASFALSSSQTSAKLLEERGVLEKELRGFIKLASWKDINVQALKASAQRTHHQLYKLIRKFRDVLRQPVSDQLRQQYAGDSESRRLDLHQSSESFDALPLSPFPSNSSGSVLAPARLQDLTSTFKKFADFLRTRIQPFIGSHSALVVDNVAVDIIVATKELAAITITATPAEKREKQIKALMVRKRKAWSDLLKELKRAGFTVNMKADILRQQSDVLWIREQPLLQCPLWTIAPTVDKGEEYYNRLNNIMPTLRASLSGHHPDLVTRDLQKGVMFVESVFAMAVECRTRLADAFDVYEKLQHLTERLHRTAASGQIMYHGHGPAKQVRTAHDTMCRLAAALEEIRDGLLTFDSFQPTPRVADPLFEQVRSIELSTQTLRAGLKRVCDDIGSFSLPILLKDEEAIVADAIQHFTQTSVALQTMAEEHPRLQYLLLPVTSWLESQPTVALCSDADPTVTDTENTDGVIDLLLVHVQSILSICPVDSMEEPEEQDRYIEHDYHHVRDLTRLFKLKQTLDYLQNTIVQFVAQPHDIQTRLQRFLPFLDLYLQVAQRQLISHSEWTKALFKLDFVLCSVTQTIAKDGFCRPPDADDAGDSAGTSEVSGGMGLGAGEGSQNVSKEIEDESQVEGLKGDDEDGNDPKGNNDDDDAIEMSEDVGGSLEDVPEDEENQDDSNSEQGSEADPEEQLGDLDASDPSAVDEKLWGDEQGPKDSSEKDDKTDQDHSEQKSGDSEVVAKEGEQQSQPKDKKDSAEQPTDQEPPANAEDDAAVEGEEDQDRPDASGAPMDDYVQDANTLDLPDDMDLGTGEEMAEDMEMEDGLEDETMADVEEEPAPDTETSKEQANPDDRPADDAPEPMDGQEAEPPVQATEDIDGESPENEDEPDDNAVARPDVTAGEGEADPNTDENENGGESAETGQAGRSAGVSGKDASAAEENAAAEQGAPEPSKPSDQPPGASESEVAGASTEGPQEGQAQSQPNMQLESNPLRSLGDALKEIRQRFNEIMDAPQGDTPREQPVPTEEEAPTGAEYLRPDDADHDMQALGPAGEEQVAKLNELTLLDAEQQSGALPPMDVDPPLEAERQAKAPEIQHLHDGASLQQPRPDTEGAMVHDATHDSARRTAPNDTAVPTADVDIEDADANANVELELRQWQTTGMADEGAERIWRLYESLTHDLAYALCEQLRLILEPTLATRLKGDYRTGKRLNMKKIISYIASDYTKDKIWLRRTRPSQREYQVLISLDDSKSMAESHSVHLAFETLALVSKALSRLEAGDVAIAKFGERVDILHGFDEGPFTDQAGTKLMSAFRFDQKATDVLALVETSLRVLEAARERRAMGSGSSAADLWQLQFIISDGMCQDHERLRTVLRKAEEQRVMIVFVIVDSLHSQAAAGAKSKSAAVVQGSILTMEKAEYKNVDGRMELQLQRYLDSFPFEYYVVLRNVEALPDVLAGTLRQFFERVSEE